MPTLTYNKKLLLTVSVLLVLLSSRLVLAAVETNNWRGFLYTEIQLLVLGIGTYFAIRQRKTTNSSVPTDQK